MNNIESPKNNIQNSFNDKFSFKQMLLSIKQFLHEIFTYPLYLMVHPIGAWESFKKDKKGKLWVAIFYLLMMSFSIVILSVGKGFLAGGSVNKDFNLLLTISFVIVPTFIAMIANWCVSTLFDGKGKMKQIFITICYSFFPFVWISLFATIFSNFIILDEYVYVTFFNSIAIFLTVYLLFFGLMGVHEYSFIRNILMLIATIVAIAVILFIALLFFSLIQQMMSWIATIYTELKMRYL